VMVTHWDGHWDALPNNETYYTKKMIRFELEVDKLLDGASTLFIKLDKETKKPEKLGLAMSTDSKTRIMKFASKST